MAASEPTTTSTMHATRRYWEHQWGQSDGCPGMDPASPNADFRKTIGLLYKYSGSLVVRQAIPGNVFAKFFTGRLFNHYKRSAAMAIRPYRHPCWETCHGLYQHTVENILARLKRRIGNHRISVDDDLHQILAIVKQHTGVDYAALDPHEVLTRYDTCVYMGDFDEFKKQVPGNDDDSFEERFELFKQKYYPPDGKVRYFTVTTDPRDSISAQVHESISPRL